MAPMQFLFELVVVPSFPATLPSWFELLEDKRLGPVVVVLGNGVYQY